MDGWGIVIMDVKEAVQAGYSQRATAKSAVMGLEAVTVCRAGGIDRSLLENVPQEVIDHDYGCGNPTRFARMGDVVLDLGSGSGKICYALAQVVGKTGAVIGIDMNPDMLELARRNQGVFTRATGLSNLTFARAHIQDLALDLEAADVALAGRTIGSFADFEALEKDLCNIRVQKPLIADESVDLVVSNCVINLVETGQKDRVWTEIFRILKPGGRIALSDNVSSKPIPARLRNDPDLWVGCYAGVYEEQAFYRALVRAGFVGLTIENRMSVPDKTVDDIEFRSVTVTAHKPASVACGEADRAVLYRGPFQRVELEGGQTFQRGQPTPVNATTAALLSLDPLVAAFETVNGLSSTPDDGGQSGCCS